MGTRIAQENKPGHITMGGNGLREEIGRLWGVCIRLNEEKSLKGRVDENRKMQKMKPRGVKGG